MKHRMGRTLASLAAVATLALAGFGCAEEVGDIDRTQPNKVKKAELAGHWYFLQTVADVPVQSSQSFIGLTNFGNNPKIMFEVTEHNVFVVPVTENVQFSEAPYKLKMVRNYWTPGKSHEFIEMYIGQPIAAYPIEAHFDVIRSYNPATGKQSNVIVENSTDRVWHEREFMRVNWGGTKLLDWAFATGSQTFSTVDHYVQEGEDQFLKEAGAGSNPDTIELEADYIGFVTKAFIPPSGRDWQGYACSPYGISNKDCAGATVKVRHSFRKAPVNNDYETFVYTNGEHMDKFGLFLSTRYAYDDLWNLTESKRDYKAQRWNLWQKTWNRTDMTDDNGDLISCRSDLDCPADAKILDYQGTQCIKPDYFETGKCVNTELMQFAKRGLNPIVYHISAGFDSFGCTDEGGCMSDAIEQVWYEAADEWSETFKSAVAWSMALEEAGQYWTRSCDVNTDCTAGRSDVLADATIPTPKTVPLHPSQGCAAGSVAAGDQCLAAVACDDSSPCSLGQLCDTGACYFNENGAKGAQVLNPVMIPGAQAVTMVVFPKADGSNGVIPVRDDWLFDSNNPTETVQMGGGSAVRFVNASEGIEAGLQGISTELPYAEGSQVNNIWATDSGSVTLTAVSGGATVATANVDFTPGWVYIAVLVNGNELVVAGTKINSGTGVRYLHAVPGTGAVDAGLTSVRAVQAMVFGTLSDYNPSRFDEQRITITAAGSTGDVTCFYTQHEGRCVGWAGQSANADALYEQKMAELPDMFVICENQYNAGTAETQYTDATSRDRLTVYHDGRYSFKGKNPYAVAGEQELADPNAIYNPCQSFVTKPAEMKKIGDVRYNFMYWVGEPQASSPLGYGPSGGDPETGQLIWGNAYIYGAPLLTYGQWASDIVDLINGELTSEGIVSGEYIKSFVESKGGDPLPMDNEHMFTGGLEEIAHAHGHSAKDVYLTHPQFDLSGRVTGPISEPFQEELWEFMDNKLFQKQLLSGLPQVSNTYAKDRLDKIRNTPIEDILLSDEVRAGLTGDATGTQTLTDDMRKELSPASWATGTALREQHAHQNMLMANAPCTYDTSFVDDTVFGLAKEHFCTAEEFAQFEVDPAALGGKVCKSGDDLRWELTRRIFGGVLEHEIGHTVSLRHNFAASVDVFNFQDKWYSIREKEEKLCQASAHCDEDIDEICQTDIACSTSADCPGRLGCNAGLCTDAAGISWGACAVDNVWAQRFVPRTVQTPSEREQGMAEYQYSSIMDYGGRFNSDIQGLGKYDKAAIKFGYAKLVEVYKDPSNMRNRMNAMAARYGREPSYFANVLSTDGWRYAGTIFHPFFYLEDYIGVEENLSRTTVPYERVKLEQSMNTTYQDDRFYWTYIEVPYRFCSDEFRGNLGCYTWDTGIDIGEIVSNMLVSIDEYYVWDAFKRESFYKGSDSMINSYFGRVMSRYMAVMGDAGRYFAIYDNIFNDRQWYPDHVKNPYGMKVLADSARTSFNSLAQMLASPAPGSFVRDEDGVFRNVTYDLDMPDADLTVPLGTGKFPYTQYLSADHYGFENHAVWVGSFWLKLAALMTLTDGTFTSSSDWVGEQLEVGRSTSVGFNTLYQREMTNLIGGIVAGSLGHYSGVAVQDAQTGEARFEGRDLFNPLTDEGRDPIEPGIDDLNMRVWTAALGMANLPAGFDPSFTDAMAVFVEGNGYEYDLSKAGANVQIAKFADPFGGKTYVAYQPNYDAQRLAPAYKIVTEAQAIREQWETASGLEKDELAGELRQRIELLDILRLTHSKLGNLEY